ncbi:MAG: tetratricopeptide repeat protein [Gammaproteobacteria bacterium]
MKSILSGKSILIVEDYSVMRKTIRDMLYALEADDITEADNGENAIVEMVAKRFDIVLCDYNLGKGKNGQQVLEEARVRQLLAPNGIFIIIAAEQSVAMVLGAMDSKPDEYITKPFNAQQLFSRIERNLRRKQYLENVEKEVQRGNYLTAIHNCELLLEKDDKKMRTHVIKRRAELATLIGDFDVARRLYWEILEQYELPWARLGLGIIEYQQTHFEKAVSIFEALLQENPMYLEGYDWLSKAYEAQDRPFDVQEVLNQAVDLSPQSILRQKRLAETADKNGNNEVAEKAYKAAVSLGKHSVYKTPADFTNLAKLYSKIDASPRALSTLKDMRHEFPNNPEAELRSAALEVQLHKQAGDDELAEKSLKKALALNEQLGNQTPKDLQLDLVRSCIIQSHAGQAEQILKSLIKTHIEDDSFIDDIRHMQSATGMANQTEAMIQATKRELVETNNKGVTLYKQGRFNEAMELFEKAMSVMPDNKTISINMLKILIHDLKNTGISEEKLHRIQTLFKKCRQVGIDAQKLGIMQLEFSKVLQRKKDRENA